MIYERAYELLCCQLGLANEEKVGLRKQVDEHIERLKAIEESKLFLKNCMNIVSQLAAKTRHSPSR